MCYIKENHELVTVYALGHDFLLLRSLRINWNKLVENVDFWSSPYTYLGRFCRGKDWKKGRPVSKRQTVCKPDIENHCTRV